MSSYVEKREVLCKLAEIYLNTRKDSYISIHDGIMDSHDFDSIHFLMLLALTFSKEEMKSLYSMDIEVSQDIRICFVEKEYSKVIKQKKPKEFLGQMILQDAKIFYESQYGEDNYKQIDDIGKNFFSS